MRILGTTDERFLSKALRFFYEEPFSHIGIGFDHLGLVIDSSTSGVKITRIGKWSSEKKNRIIDTIEIPISERKEWEIFNKILDAIEGKRYDFPSYIFHIALAFKYKLFKSRTNLKKSRFNDKNGVLCTEVFYPIVDELKKLGVNIEGVELSVLTPYRVMEIMRGRA